MLGANGIVGGGPPLVCGAALTAKTLKTGGVAVAFVGDGASNQGTTLESLQPGDRSGTCRRSSSSRTTAMPSRPPRHGRSPAARSSARPGFGMPAREVDGHDFFAVYEAARRGDRAGARRRRADRCIHVKLNRYYGHFEGDAMTYRGPGRGRDGCASSAIASSDLPPARDRGRRCSSAGRARRRSTARSAAAIDRCGGCAPRRRRCRPRRDLMTDVYVIAIEGRRRMSRRRAIARRSTRRCAGDAARPARHHHGRGHRRRHRRAGRGGRLGRPARRHQGAAGRSSAASACSTRRSPRAPSSARRPAPPRPACARSPS